MRRSGAAIILAESNDLHAAAVAAEIQSAFNRPVAILSVAGYPQDWQLTLRTDGRGRQKWMVHTKDFITSSDGLTGVWLRSNAAHKISSKVKDRTARQFCSNEANFVYKGWLECLGLKVINPISAQDAVDRKPYQLLVAGKVGLSVPKTLVTSDPEAARAFVDHLGGRVIFKGLGRRPDWGLIETRRFKSTHLPELASLEFAPVIFQEAIEADSDIRVTIIDETVFAASIKSRQLDWRLDESLEIRPHILPQRTKRALVALLRTLGLRYGAIDMRLTPKGDYIFLEVNTRGDFIFCEVETGHRITHAVAGALLQSPVMRPERGGRD
jgi:RimK-like ATP-grasp domain